MLQLSRKTKLFLVLVLTIASLCNGFYFPYASADSLTNEKDTISDSRKNIPADHKIEFTTTIDIGDNGYFEVTIPADFGEISTGTCSGPNVSVSTTTETIRCAYSTSPGAATSTVIYLYDLVNPSSTGNQSISIKTYNSSDDELESGQAAVFVTAGVSMSAFVAEELSFSMSDADSISFVNGILLTGSSTATTVPFSLLTPNASSTIAQTLSVETNAENGFSLTLYQRQDLANQSGNTINSFNNSPDNQGSTTPQTWAPPLNILGHNNTYGHIGVTTDDATLSSLDFTGSKYVGLKGSETVEVMYHNSRADGITQNIGLAHVAYTIEISDLQEAGNYQNTLVYICTPTF